MIKKKTRRINIVYDYIKLPGRENPYGYFEYDDLTEQEISQVGEFRRLAKEHLEYSIKYGDKIPDMHTINILTYWNTVAQRKGQLFKNKFVRPVGFRYLVRD